jgi:general transcription factor 3C polypeptide 3 (transcription factor C subunit 4)
MRKDYPDAHFNIARAYHQIGVTHLAVPYYENVLNWGGREEGSVNDLAREAAYNLSLIYVCSGGTALARSMLKKYCTIYTV